MKTILHSFFGRAESAAGHSVQPAGPQSVHAAPPGADLAEITARRQLVEKLLNNLLRRSGMPASWVEPQMLVLSSRTRGSGAHLRLVLKHGDEQLLKYIFALQRQLQKDIHDADTTAGQWLQGISWQLDIDNSCLRTTLPDRAFWQPVIDAQDAKHSAKKPVAALPVQAAAHQAVVQAPRAAVATSAAAAAPSQTSLTSVPAKAAAAPSTAASAASSAPAGGAAAAASPLPAAALQALRQLREARANGTLTAFHAAVPATPAAPLAAPPVAAKPPVVAPAPAPAKPRAAPDIAKARLDYGAPNFECSRPAEETDLTPDLAALFALDESQWKPRPAKS